MASWQRAKRRRKPPGATTAGGWGEPHQRRRAAIAPIVNAGKAVCRCNQPIWPGQEWHLDHNDASDGYLGVAHARCNLAAGAHKANGKRRLELDQQEQPYRWSQRWHDDPHIGTVVLGHEQVIYFGNGDWQPLTGDAGPCLPSARTYRLTMRGRRLGRIVLVACLLIVLLALVQSEASVVYDYQGWSGTRTDFFGTIWWPNHQVLHGESPYEDPSLNADPASVYPPSGFLPYVPLAWLAPHTAVVLFQLLLIAAAAGTLLALRVRSPYAWTLWLTCPLVVMPVLGGNITPVVVLGVALMWRWRDRPARAAAALTAAIAIKLFVAPLLIWLLITRRFRAALITAVAAPAVILASWVLIGFRGMLDYPAVLRVASKAFGADGPFLQALARQLGQNPTAALIIGAFATTALVVLASRTDEVKALVLICLACLALSPVAWGFYAGILVVPLAAARIHVSAWLILPAFWAVSWWYTPLPYKSAELSIVNLLLCVALAAFVLTTRPRAASASTRMTVRRA